MTISDAARGYRAAEGYDVPVMAVIAALATFAALLHVFTPFNHDEAWVLESAGRLLEGGRFGSDVIDVNPPLVWWIGAMPAWVARQIGMRADVVATAFTTLMAVFSFFAVDRLIDKSLAPHNPVLLLTIALLVLFTPGYDFGQREHWAVLLTLPYVAACSLRIDEVKLSTIGGIGVGIAAALGFCLKPYFLLIPVALEILVLLRTRRPFLCFRPETITVALTGLAYAVLIVVLAPDYLKRVVPNAMLGYWTYSGSLVRVLHAAVLLVIPSVAAAAIGRSTSNFTRTPALAQCFAVAGLAGLAAALMQMKAWPYHFLLGVLFLELYAAVLLLAGTPRGGADKIRYAGFAFLIAVGVLNSATEIIHRFDDRGTEGRVAELAAVFRANAGPNKAVFGFITSPRDVLPAAVASQTKWAAPFCCVYLLPAALRADEAPATKRDAIRDAAREQVETALAAIRAEQPGVIVVDAADRMLAFGDRKFDYIGWLEAHTDFADILRHYHEIDPIGSFRVFVRG